MYIAGTIENFESRLHQLADSQGDLDDFIVEGNTYVPSVDASLVRKWDTEFAKRKLVILQDSSYYSSDALS